MGLLKSKEGGLDAQGEIKYAKDKRGVAFKV